MAGNWTPSERDEVAWHVEYEVRKLIEYVRALDRFPPTKHADVGQALLEASLVHLRLLHEFLHPTPQRADSAYAGLWVASWSKRGYLTGRQYGRISAKVAHLSASRLRSEFDDFQAGEIKPLAVACCETLRDFLDALPSPEPEGFVKGREHVVGCLPGA